tara:strand:- start:1536 stop:1715 length:180 start_codon:yes stop_codon:yes gene_type:complete
MVIFLKYKIHNLKIYLEMFNRNLEIKEIKTSFPYLIILSFVGKNFNKERENNYNKLFMN